MNIFVLSFSLCLIIAQLALPRKYAFLPLIVVVAHLGKAEIFGPFTTGQVVILVGVARAIVSGFFEFNLKMPNTKVIVFMIAYLLFSSLFHNSDTGNPLIARIGLSFNIIGTYFYGTSYIKDYDDIRRYSLYLCFVLAPLAFFMFSENQTRQNSYKLLGAKNPEAVSRDGRIRAQGPFAHSILAGTAGATCIPLVIIALRRRKSVGIIGLISCAVIVYSSSSSGPILTTAAAFGSLYLWKLRDRLGLIKVVGVLMVIAASLAMMRPPWHLMARVNIVGGSTGWHRARLMDKGLEHLGDWWFAGTDYTRHWMASGVNWSPNHVDMTNYFLHLGVIGGLPVMVALIIIILRSFKNIGIETDRLFKSGSSDSFVLWAIGSSLFAHTITFLSVSYYDQMFIFFYFLIGIIASVLSIKARKLTEEERV